MKGLRLYKYEKLCSKKAIEDLFAAKNNSVKSYPIRLIYLIEPFNGTPAKFYISVPKRKIRHAVDRVLMRRRIRENSLSVNIAIMYMHDNVSDYALIEEKLKNALSELAEVIENNKDIS